MPREHYEREKDREAEREIIRVFADLGGFEVHRLQSASNAYYATLDFLLTAPSDIGVAWVEVKDRKHAFATYPTLMLSAGKFRDGAVWSRATGVPFVILIRYTDGIYYYKYDAAHVGIASSGAAIVLEWGGRTSQTRDQQDTEPVVHIPWQLFSAATVENVARDFPMKKHP